MLEQVLEAMRAERAEAHGDEAADAGDAQGERGGHENGDLRDKKTIRKLQDRFLFFHQEGSSLKI